MPTASAQAPTLTLRQAAEEIQRLLSRGPDAVPDALQKIFEGGVHLRASDIHFDPLKDRLRVRYRIDGIFNDVASIAKDLHDQVVSRAKVLGNLISHRREIIQEGRITFTARGQILDLRLSIVPTISGEKMVIRIFDPRTVLFELSDLGFSPSLLDSYLAILRRMQGMVIFTGPSGVGKTTTMYSSLKRIHDEMDQYASIITIEDPVEYEVGLFCQMQVNRARGIDFANCLGSVLRQDPEVIMIGEIRNLETCEVALRAGLTGHLVLTTIHSGAAPGVITRIIEMGVEPFIIASSVSGILAQRLVRNICPECRTTYTPDGRHRQILRAHGAPDEGLPRGKGCERCQGSGYYGRTAIGELLVMNDAMRARVLEKLSTRDLARAAREQGMKTILEDGIEKVKAGVTTVEEVLRGTGVTEG